MKRALGRLVGFAALLAIAAAAIHAGTKGSPDGGGEISQSSEGPSCKTNWRYCQNNAELFANRLLLVSAITSCERAATERARYGTPKWPGFWDGGSFRSFFPGNSVATTGKITLVEKDVQFQNGFGAMVHSRVACRYDLNLDRVEAVEISERL